MPASESNLQKELRAQAAHQLELHSIEQTVLQAVAAKGHYMPDEVKTMAGQSLAFAIIGWSIQPQNKSILDAFEYCGLDFNEPDHWLLLLRVFALVCFKKGGAPSLGDTRIAELREHIDAIGGFDGRTDTEIASKLKSDKTTRELYRNAKSLRKLVSRARQFKFPTHEELARASFERKLPGMPMPEELRRGGLAIVQETEREYQRRFHWDRLEQLAREKGLPLSEDVKKAFGIMIDGIVNGELRDETRRRFNEAL